MDESLSWERNEQDDCQDPSPMISRRPRARPTGAGPPWSSSVATLPANMPDIGKCRNQFP